MTPYRGVVVLSDVTLRYPNPVCGLPTTYAGNLTLLLFRRRTIARPGGRETTNKTCRPAMTCPHERRETPVRGHDTRAQQYWVRTPCTTAWVRAPFTGILGLSSVYNNLGVNHK